MAWLDWMFPGGENLDQRLKERLLAQGILSKPSPQQFSTPDMLSSLGMPQGGPAPAPAPSQPSIMAAPPRPVRLPPSMAPAAEPIAAPARPPATPLPDYGAMGPGQFDTALGERSYPVESKKAPMDILFSGANLPTGRGFAGMEPQPKGENGKGNRWARLGGKVVDALIGPGAKGMSKTDKAMTLLLSLGQGVKTGMGMQYGYQGPSFLEAARLYGKQFEEEQPMREFREYIQGQIDRGKLSPWQQAQLMAEKAGMSLPADPLEAHNRALDRLDYQEKLRRERPAKPSASVKTTWGEDPDSPGWLTQLERDPDSGDWTPSLRDGKPIRKRAPRAKGSGGATSTQRMRADEVWEDRQRFLELPEEQRFNWIMRNPQKWDRMGRFQLGDDPKERAAWEKVEQQYETMMTAPPPSEEEEETGGGWFDWLPGRGGKQEAPLPMPDSPDKMKPAQVYEKAGRYYVVDEAGNVIEVEWQD